MAGATGVYIGMTAGCGILYLYIFVVSFMIRKRSVYFHPDTLVLLIGLLIGVAANMILDYPIRSLPGVSNINSVIGSALFPALILTHTIHFYEGAIFGRVKINLMYAILPTLLNMGIAYAITIIFTKFGVLPASSTSQMVISSFLLSLDGDNGYRMCQSLTGDVNLYKIIRERYAVDYVMIVSVVYAFRDNSIHNSHSLQFTYEVLVALVLSVVLGMVLGGVSSLIQASSQIFIENPMLNMMFIIMFAYTTYFIGQVNSDYVNEEVIIFTFGMMLAFFGKFNLDPNSARRFYFVLEFFGTLTKACILIISGVICSSSFSTPGAIKAAGVILGANALARLITQGTLFLICRRFQIGQIKFRTRDFWLLYLTSLSKGSVAFVLIRKFLPFGNVIGDMTDIIMIFSAVTFDSLTFIFSKLFFENEISTLEEQANLHNEDLTTSVFSSSVPVLKFLMHSLISPILINRYSDRKEESELDRISEVEEMVMEKVDLIFSKKDKKNKKIRRRNAEIEGVDPLDTGLNE